jgi:cell division septation protein DedD
MMERERRLSDRKTLNPLPYINLPGDNGGLVLDISEQGLRFRATAPVEQTGPILFWFTAHSNLIAGIAELAWTDETKKNGGLRFTQLPYNAREQIRKWPYEPAFRPSFSQDLTLHIPAADGASARGISLEDSNIPPMAEDTFTRKTPEAESFEAVLRETQRSLEESVRPEKEFLPWETYLKPNWRPMARTICAVLLGIIIPTFAYMHHRDVGQWLVRVGMKLSGQVSTVAAATSTPLPLTQVKIPSLSVMNPSASLSLLAPPAPVPTAKAEAPKEKAPAAPASVPAKTESAKEKAPVLSVAKEDAAEAQAAKPATNRGTQLIVQVAALEKEDDARSLAESLRQKNFKASVSTLPGDSLFRVTLGPYQDAASARSLVGKLKKAGIPAFIRREAASGAQGT